MLAVDCECGGTVPFIAEERTKAPLEEACEDCGRMYRLKVKKVYTPQSER